MTEDNQGRRADDHSAWIAISENRANITSLAQRLDRFENSLVTTLTRMEAKLDSVTAELEQVKGKFKGGWLVLAALGGISTGVITIYSKLF